MGQIKEKNSGTVEVHIIVDWKGCIHNVSSEILNLFRISKNDLPNYKYISDIFPELWEFREDFEKEQDQIIPRAIIQNSEFKNIIKNELSLII